MTLFKKINTKPSLVDFGVAFLIVVVSAIAFYLNREYLGLLRMALIGHQISEWDIAYCSRVINICCG